VISIVGALLTAAWAVLALAGGATVGSIHLSPLAAAAGCGATALVAAMPFGDDGADFLLVPAMLVGLPVAAALAAGGHTALPLVLAVAVIIGSSAPEWRKAGAAGPAAVVGLIGMGVGLALSRGDLRPGDLAVEETLASTAFLVAAAGLIAAATLAPSTLTRVRLLLLPAVIIGCVTTPTPDGAVVLAAALAVAAVAPALARARPAGAVAFASMAAAGLGPTRPAAALLAAAAVLLDAAGPPSGVIGVLPGVVAPAVALATTPLTVTAGAVGVALAAACAAAAVSARGPVVLAPGRLPAAGLLAWLVVAPASWAWAGSRALGPYQDGSSRAVAAGLLVLVGAWTLGQTRPRGPEWHTGGW
jgi:hypothetical protein